jgi:hypothetical protein
VVVSLTARDASGIDAVTLRATSDDGRSASVGVAATGGSGYGALWIVPSCRGGQDRWQLTARAADRCGNADTDAVTVRRTCGDDDGDGSSGGPGAESRSALAWTSELALAGGRGQVVANGAGASFPSAGRGDVFVRARPGVSTVEATVVDARGASGTWRFTLASGAIRPGSLRVIAGEVAASGPQMVLFRLHGRPGERVVFSYEVP